jgi:hypothetical protein
MTLTTFYVVKKRLPGEEWDIRQFVTPNVPGVARIETQLPAGEREFVATAWWWVTKYIQYPEGSPDVEDEHYFRAFRGRTRRAYRVYDYWSFPAETLVTRIGDCEDASFLLASILRRRLPDTRVFVTIGLFDNYGHAWVTVDGLVLETTPGLPSYKAIPEQLPYVPFFRFNDTVVLPVREIAVPSKGDSRLKMVLLMGRLDAARRRNLP